MAPVAGVVTAYDYLIVGAGFFGSTFAWHARQANKSVLVVDKRSHVGGNCYTYQHEGINVHAYGPHIFHTSDERTWRFITRFANFNSYVHRVKAINGHHVLSLPINLMTMNQLWGISTPSEALAKLRDVQVHCDNPRNMEEWALSQVGEELYETLIKGYTQKQWGRSPKQLPASILRRLPIRTSWDDNYFNDKHQGIPIGGYTQVFERLLEGCDVRLNVDYLQERTELDGIANRIIYTGPIDAFYGYSLGYLEYRTLDFKTEIIDVVDFQGCAQINNTDVNVPWTRAIEHKHFDWIDTQSTVVTWETPKTWSPGAEPYYPITDEANNALYRRYRAMASCEANIVFGGRLGTYRYYDMHQVIAQAMTLAKQEGLTPEGA